jgi:serine/threonine-protein kinase SRPK3
MLKEQALASKAVIHELYMNPFSLFLVTPTQMESLGSGTTYMPIDGVESLEGYCTGGFHPITIGDHLHDRYQIVHKLGFGSYSTVWLAWDERTSKYVAIKIAAPADDSQESIILGLLQLANGHPVQALFPPILDEFFVTGPNGKHRCFVTLPARSSLDHAQNASDSGLFELSVARAIAAQVILAVCALHSQGIVHLGR